MKIKLTTFRLQDLSPPEPWGVLGKDLPAWLVASQQHPAAPGHRDLQNMGRMLWDGNISFPFLPLFLPLLPMSLLTGEMSLLLDAQMGAAGIMLQFLGNVFEPMLKGLLNLYFGTLQHRAGVMGGSSLSIPAGTAALSRAEGQTAQAFQREYLVFKLPSCHRFTLSV